MELFSVTCITCRATLKVRHPSAIGQILPCPRCNGMVQITPPPSWTAPPKQERAAAGAVPPPLHQTLHEEASLIPPAQVVAPGEARMRQVILVAGAVVAASIIGFGIWSSLDKHEDLPTDVLDMAAAAPVASPTALPKPIADPTPTATTKSTSPLPASTPTASAVASTQPAAAPSATLPQAVASATASVTAPSATAVPKAPEPAPPPLPLATASAVPPPASLPPQIMVPPQMIDLAARLQDKLPSIELDKIPLQKALGIFSELSTIRISYDWDSITDAGMIERTVSLTLTDLTLEQAIARALSECGLESVAVGDQLLVNVPTQNEPSKAVDYAIDSLVGDDPAAANRLVEMISVFVAPETWKAAGGSGTIVAAGAKLSIVQTVAAQRETGFFLDRLRLARGKAPVDSKTSLLTRLDRAREVLTKPVTMNYRPGEPLERVLDYLEEATGAVLTVDYPALMSAGYQGTELIGCAADKHPLSDVLTAVCGPRDWAWRVVGERTFDITTRDALRRRPYVEFYPVPASATGEGAGANLALKIRTQLADEGWRSTGGRGDIAFDELSNKLVVRQHQEAHSRIEKMLAEMTPPAAP